VTSNQNTEAPFELSSRFQEIRYKGVGPQNESLLLDLDRREMEKRHKLFTPIPIN